MNLKKISLFVMILIVGLTVVTAADVIDDDSSVAIDAPQVEQTNNIQKIDSNVMSEEEQTTTNTRETVTISSDVTIDNTNYDTYNNKDWTVSPGVTVTGTENNALTDVSIKVDGNGVTLKNLDITSQDISSYLINATNINNLRIDNSQLTITNVANTPTIGIYVKDSSNVIINGTTLTVNAPAQSQYWNQTESGEWYSTLQVSAVYSDHSNNVKLENSTVTITNTTHNTAGTTMPAVTVRNNSNQVSIKNNTISSTGAQYVYGVMMNDLVNNVETINNTVSVSGLYYVAGIDASTASNSKTCKNKVTAISENAESFPYGCESLAYGIISDTYTSGNTANHICQNTIDITANTCYGIEMYNGMNNFICTNNITANANKTMGVAVAQSSNNKIINNNMSLTGTTTDSRYFYEEVTPVNAGVIFTNQSTGNLVQGNNISLDSNGDNNARAVVFEATEGQESTSNTITGNVFSIEIDSTTTLTSDAAISDIWSESLDNYLNIHTPNTNEAINLYPCSCDCGCYETNPTSENVLNKNNMVLKGDDSVIIIDDSNYEQYGTIISDNRYTDCVPELPYYLFNNNLTGNIILNLSIIKNYANFFSSSLNIQGIYHEGHNILFLTGYQIDFDYCYAPNTTIISYFKFNVRNSIVNQIYFNRTHTNMTNNIIINKYNGWIYDSKFKEEFTIYPIYLKSGINAYTRIYNNYLVGYNDTNIVTGNSSIYAEKISGTGHIIENNTPNYGNGYVLTDDNYPNLFDEDNILMDNATEESIIAVEEITNPVIINQQKTVASLFDGGYNTVTLTDGSEDSKILDSKINKLIIDGAINVEVNNNTFTADDSEIEVINSLGIVIENNTINTKNEYTITLDEDSSDNIVRYNELIANKFTGDASVLYPEDMDNTIEGNTPEYVEPVLEPELKIDTTEFTVGSTANITASIYLDDEIASDITGGKVVFKVNGKTLKDANGKVIYAKVVNGQATIEDYEIPSTWKEGTTITAVYSGSTLCDKLTSEATEISITQEEPAITTESVTAPAGQTIQLTATVNVGQEPITVGKVVFKVNGKAVKDANGKVIYATIDENGQVSVNYTIPENMKAKDYTITVTYTSALYGTLNNTATLTVN